MRIAYGRGAAKHYCEVVNDAIVVGINLIAGRNILIKILHYLFNQTAPARLHCRCIAFWVARRVDRALLFIVSALHSRAKRHYLAAGRGREKTASPGKFAVGCLCEIIDDAVITRYG